MTELQSSLRQRLLDAEIEFLTVRDASALHEFSERWAVLCEDFEKAMESDTLDDSLKSLAHSVAYRVATLAEAQQELNDAFMHELDALFANLSLAAVAVPKPPMYRDRSTMRRPSPSTTTNVTSAVATASRSTTSSTPSPSTSSTLPFYPSAYDWLVLNIHDPYPSKALKDSFAKSANVKSRVIDSWFKTVRKEIGWDALRRSHFKGSRNFTSAAALRCFAEDGQDLPFEIAAGLLAMRRKAETLFPSSVRTSSSHRRSTSASSTTTVDSSAPGTTPSSPLSSPPALSRPPSLVFSASDSDEEELPISASSSQESLSKPHDMLESTRITASQYDRLMHVDLFGPVTRRPAIEINTLIQILTGKISIATHTPHQGEARQSTTAYLDAAPGLLDPHNPFGDGLGPTPSMPILAPTSHSRKRRRSDADLSPPSKRCKTVGASRPQVVSAPLPRSTNPLQSSAAGFQQGLVANSQTFLVDETDQASNLVLSYGDISQYVNFGPLDDAYCNSAPSCGQTVVEPWAGDNRPLSEIVEDAPSSTTLKLLPLPDVDASYPTEPVAFGALAERKLPPIHWSSSSLAGALGPLDQEHTSPAEPITTLDDSPPETPPLDVAASFETRDADSHTSTPFSLDAILSNPNWEDSVEETIPISSRLEDAESYEHASIQQLLELLDSPSCATGWAF